MVTKQYLTCAETAKLVRKQLATHFPGTKFSVRSSNYSGGASISIGWTFGPTTKEVDQIAGNFEGASFDGMNDLQSNQDSWLLPDGSAQLAYRPGDYGGSVPGFVSDAPAATVQMVSFGADYIHTSRSFGATWQDEQKLREQIGADMCKLQRVAYTGENTRGLYGAFDTEDINQHVWRLLSVTPFAPGETYAGVRYATEEEQNEYDQHGRQNVMRIIKQEATR